MRAHHVGIPCLSIRKATNQKPARHHIRLSFQPLKQMRKKSAPCNTRSCSAVQPSSVASFSRHDLCVENICPILPRPETPTTAALCLLDTYALLHLPSLSHLLLRYNHESLPVTIASASPSLDLDMMSSISWLAPSPRRLNANLGQD